MERIAVNGVCKTFTLKPGQTVTVDGVTSNRIAVLDGVDLSIDRGEFITLVGPSGSGKSVLLDVIAGLTGATSGVASIDGIEVSKPHARTAYVFQQYALFPWRTALQNVEYALEVRGVPAAERREKARHFCTSSGSTVSRTVSPLSFPGACSSAWRSPGHCRPIRRYC